jgi:ABC-type molybdate transport system substrate-binding protein
MPKSVIRLYAVVLALLAGLYAGAAGAVELKVLSTEAMRATLQELAPAFEAASKHKLVIAYATDADVEKKVASDETIDIAILTKPGADNLVKKARIVGGTAEVLAKGASPDLVYVVGASFACEQPLAAKALIDFLTGPAAKKVIQAKGLQTS